MLIEECIERCTFLIFYMGILSENLNIVAINVLLIETVGV